MRVCVQFGSLGRVLVPRETVARLLQKKHMLRRLLARAPSLGAAGTRRHVSSNGWFGRMLDTFQLPAEHGVDNLHIDIRTWKVLGDSDYGGRSVCDATTTASLENSSSSGTAAQLVFTGEVLFDASLSESTNNAKGGFCAVMGTVPVAYDLRDYQGLSLELRCTSPQPHRFTVNMAAASLFEGDLYQLDVMVMDKWATLHLPFDHFRLTSRGVEREEQRKADAVHLERIGFLFRQPNGETFQLGFLCVFHNTHDTSFKTSAPFELHVGRILAVAHLDDRFVVRPLPVVADAP